MYYYYNYYYYYYADLCDLEPWNYFRCVITRRCISNNLRCNGKPDCLYCDWSDENNCLWSDN